MKFDQHPSSKLLELYKMRPYQGQSPEKAKIIFLSSDANYSPEISNHPFFETILEYHMDGIAFWKQHGCHHPFLLPFYPFNKNTGGVPFHRTFSKLALGPEHASHISFLELLDVPTIGNRSKNNDRFFELLSPEHLKYIDNLICGGGHKMFFVSRGVLRDMTMIKKNHSLFSWYAGTAGTEQRYEKLISGNKVKEIYHFSSTQVYGQLKQIRADIDGWLKK